MNKRISKTILAMVMGLMVAGSIYLLSNKMQNYNIVDIEGSKNELGDINIVYQQGEGLYKVNEVNISKDGMEVDKNVKQTYTEHGINKFSKENRDILNFSYYNGNMYETDSIVGVASVDTDYSASYRSGDEKAKVLARINEKNIQNGKIKEYEIPIDINVRYDDNASYYTMPIRSEEGLVLAVLYEVEMYDYSEKEGREIYKGRNVSIDIYNIDLESESSKLVDTYKVNQNDDTLSHIHEFANNNKAYFMISSTEDIADENGAYNPKLDIVEYDVKSKKFKKIKTEIKGKVEEILPIAKVVDNKATFISHQIKGNKIDLYITQIDLETGNTIVNNEEYNLAIDDYTVADIDEFGYSVNSLKIHNDKIYIDIEGRKDDEDYYNSNFRQYVYVLDENTKKTLYAGKLDNPNNDYVDLVLEKEEDL